jgi:hypothetical protein
MIAFAKYTDGVLLEAKAESVLPWERAPYKLVNWWDMEKFSAEKFVHIASNLTGKSAQFCTEDGQRVVNDFERRKLASLLDGLANECEQVGLKVSCLQIRASSAALGATALIGIQVSQLLVDLGRAISSEMSAHLFMRIFPERVDFYEQEEMFGVAVNDGFPSAVRDVRESGSCYAADRNTACVMHLMRVLELGLNALAHEFGVPFDRRNWENIINDIEAKIAERYEKGKPGADKESWDKQRAFYSEAAKDFRYFKNAWRNHAQHAHEHYEASEARTILDHVKTFMAHLADNGVRE